MEYKMTKRNGLYWIDGQSFYAEDPYEGLYDWHQACETLKDGDTVKHGKQVYGVDGVHIYLKQA